MAKEDIAPSVAVVIAAHNEEGVIERLVESLLAQDYPGERSRSSSPPTRPPTAWTHSSSGSPSGTPACASSAARAAARWRRRTRPSATAEAEVVAFADAGAVWEPDALRKLVRSLADPTSGTSPARSPLGAEGTNREGLYWRYELWLRGCESAAGSITGGNGAIYAVRRADYVEVDPRFGHDSPSRT